jgi:hypothetical protein
MNAASILRRSAAALLVALAACTPPQQPASALAEPDSGTMPEPLSAAPRRPALTGLALAVANGATELFVIGLDGVEISHSAGTVGGVEADSAATLAAIRAVLADTRIWAQDGAVIVDGPAPFAGRARAQTRGGVLRLSLTHYHGEGSAEGALTAEVRGGEVTGRLTQSSAEGEAPRWMRSAFFRAPLRRIPPADWPLPTPRDTAE